jgi:hypothetical protein
MLEVHTVLNKFILKFSMIILIRITTIFFHFAIILDLDNQLHKVIAFNDVVLPIIHASWQYFGNILKLWGLSLSTSAHSPKRERDQRQFNYCWYDRRFKHFPSPLTKFSISILETIHWIPNGHDDIMSVLCMCVCVCVCVCVCAVYNQPKFETCLHFAGSESWC